MAKVDKIARRADANFGEELVAMRRSIATIQGRLETIERSISQCPWLASARGSVRVARGRRPRTQGRRSHTNSPAYRAQGLHNQRASGEGELLDQHTLIDHRRSRGAPAPCSDVVLQQAAGLEAAACTHFD